MRRDRGSRPAKKDYSRFRQNVSEAESTLIEAARHTRSGSFRQGMAELYVAGAFGAHDLISAYVWTLGSWNIAADVDDKFELARSQQYLEFLLTAEEKELALRILKKLLPDEDRGFVVENPFNPKWWGWEDDPVPARPPERDFLNELVSWLESSGWPKEAIDSLLAQRPPCNAPNRAERLRAGMFEFLASRGKGPEVIKNADTKRQYSAWLGLRRTFPP